MSTSPVPLSQINFNPLRQPGTPLALMYGGSVAGSLLSAMSGNPLAALVSEAIQNLQSSIDAINRVLNAAPVLQSLLLNSADIGVLNVASLYGPGQLGIYQGPPSFPLIGWAGSEAAPFQSPTTTITSTTTGTITTSSAHGLLVGQIVQILGTSNVAQNGFWVVATVPSGTTFTVSGFSGSSTGGTVQRVLVGGWFKTLAVGGTSYLNGIANGLFADENGNLTVNAATVKGVLSAATVLAGSLNITIILVTGLVLTNNSPSAGNVAWSACTVYYQGTAYSITAGNTTSGHSYITWTVGNTTFTEGASYTPGPTIFTIATNNGGTGDVAWNKVGAVHVQGIQLAPVLTYDGPNGSLIVNGVTFSDNTPTSGNVQWSACTVTYKGVTYNIPSDHTTLGQPWIFWQFASPNSFQFSIAQPTLGADDFVIGGNQTTGSPSAAGFFSRAYSFANHTGARTIMLEGFLTMINAENNACVELLRAPVDAVAAKAAGIFNLYDGKGNLAIRVSVKPHSGGTANAGIVTYVPQTLANLPLSTDGAVAGDTAMISDGLVANPPFYNTASGGGTNVVPVMFDGAQWRYG